jgi:hypothetical protein
LRNSKGVRGASVQWRRDCHEQTGIFPAGLAD